MEKYQLIKRIRELTQSNHMFDDVNAINRAEYTILMQTFGISWTELKKPSNTLYYEMVLTENDLRKQLEGMLKMSRRAKEKGLRSHERDIEFMVKGFLKGVRFFNLALSNEFSLIANKSYK
ncbi:MULTISPECIES: hypothetical protein [unclassified Psychrobacillus]|uniref:hypothetical protein n=1 Tax=unclassified Psychrobacillus TaxID=2636677 RepID=UPI0030FB51C8